MDTPNGKTNPDYEIVGIPTPAPDDPCRHRCPATERGFLFVQGETNLNAAQDVAVEATKAAPPIIVSGAMLFGMTPAEWVTALTVLYLLLQIGLLVPRYWAQFREWIGPNRPGAQ